MQGSTILRLSLAAALLAFAASACKSSPETESGAEQTEQPAEAELEMADELRPWLLHERVGMIAKLDPSDWGEIEPYVRQLPFSRGGGASDGEGDAGRRLVEFVQGQFRVDGLVEGIDPTRPAWMALEPNTRTAAETCQQVGLPCMMHAGLSPRFVHGFLPAKSPDELREALRPVEQLKHARVVERGDWMHVVFLLGRQHGPFGDVVAIDERTGDPPASPEDPRVTPAMATALGDNGPLAIWFDLRGAVDFGVRIGHTEVADALRVRRGGQFDKALTGTTLATSLLELDRARAAEFEDVGLVVGGNGSGDVWFDGVATQTPYGSELARAATPPPRVSEVAFEGAQMSVDWGYDVRSVGEKLRRGVGVAGEPGSIGDRIRTAGFWGYVGFLRGLRTYADAAIRASRLPLPTVLAADFRADVEQGAGPSNLRAAGAVRVVRNGRAKHVYQNMQRMAASSDAIRVDRTEVEGRDGSEEVEWQIAVRAPSSAERFGEASERTGMTGSISSEAVGRLLETLPEWFGRGARPIRRALRASALAETSMSVDALETPRYTAMRLHTGDDPADAPAVADVRFEPEEPAERCLVGVGVEVRDIVEDASNAEDPASALDRGLRDHEETFTERVDGCVEAGTATEGEREEALSAYAVTRALAAYRLGEKEEAETLLETACDGAFDWACSREFYDEWPWKSFDAESEKKSGGEPSGEPSGGASESGAGSEEESSDSSGGGSSQ